MSYFTRNMDKCSRLHSFPVTRYVARFATKIDSEMNKSFHSDVAFLD